ncbi:Ubiquinone/menaquinone biosynthesis C-methyltransferase UbiE [bacterium HR11]|nr:Ubiquinone/menaquinone biosynthesis C-methyltransferase UbiE [bacterium HR11]
MHPFDVWAFRYDEWYDRPFGRSAYVAEVACLQRLKPTFQRGLEVGVGTGRFASMLGVAFGLDPSQVELRIARARGVQPVQGVGEALPFLAESFDLVLIVVTLCFVEDPVRVLLESVRVLTPGGHVLLGLILQDSPWAEFYQTKARQGHPIYRLARFYSFEQVVSWLEAAGLRVEGVASTLFEPPQDIEPIRNLEIRDGFWPAAGFTCIRAGKIRG